MTPAAQVVPNGTTTAANDTATPNSPASTAPVPSWTALLAKATRRTKESHATLIIAGDGEIGKSSLLHHWSDRVSIEQLPALAASGMIGTGAGAGTNAAGSNAISSASAAQAAALQALGTLTGDHGLDYSFQSVRNRYAVTQAEREEILAKMHVWQLDEKEHVELVMDMMRAAITQQMGDHTTTQPNASPASSPSSAIAPSTSTPNPSSSTASSPSIDYAALSHSAIVVCFDLSEPWNVLPTVRSWLSKLERSIGNMMEQLPAEMREQLKKNVARYIQEFHTMGNNNNGTNGNTEGTNSSNENGADATSPASTASPSPDADSAAPLDPNIPPSNLGLPIILLGLRGDSFVRHLVSRSDADEKLERLTKELRKVALKYGAALIYTSSTVTASSAKQPSTPAARGGGDQRSTKETGVNIELLQHYIHHRLFNFPLHPTAPESSHATAPLGLPTLSTTSPTASSSTSSASSSSSTLFPPKLVVSCDGDFGLYIPAGYDSTSLIETTSSLGSSSSSATMSVDELFNRDQAEYFKRRSSLSSMTSTGAGGIQLIRAEENNAFFEVLKRHMEGGPGSSALAMAAGLTGLSSATAMVGGGGTGGAGAGTSRHATKPSMGSALSPSVASKAASAVSPSASPHGAAGSVAGGASTSTPTSAGAAGHGGGASGAAAAAGARGGSGQIAVKQFFKSLLSNSSVKPDGATKGSASSANAAAQKAAVRANAEKELQRMQQ